ncbi:MAG: hypothetical protein HGA37_09855 [Lentimicrobium sp.]|nr:hypothetical protein [Lentimicrobium sp.]
MKGKVKPFSFILIVVAFSIAYNHLVFGQEKFNISAGVGMPELINIGLRYQLDQCQIGLSLGLLPDDFSVCGDVYYHFAGLSEFSCRRPWYGRIGLNYLREDTDYYIDKYLYLNIRLGRDFNISNKFGIELEGGVLIQIRNEVIMKKPSSNWLLDLEFPVLPSPGIGLFYRL